MEASGNIKDYLCAQKAVATKQCMERSLSEIFRLMFNLELASAHGAALDDADSVCAHVILRHEKATACVSLRILRATALIIAERAGIEVASALTSFIVQDVACEIVNIIANNLRTFLSENTGAYFEMGEVVVNKADLAALHPDITLNLDFQVTPEALINLGFVCGDGMEKEASPARG